MKLPGRSVLAAALLLHSTLAAAQPQQQVLTLERAIEIAVAQQPALRQSRAAVEAARGRVDLARVARRPTVNLSASAAIGSSFARPCPPPNEAQTCGGFFDPTTSTGLGAQASWRLYDFGQTAIAIRAAELSAEATAVGIDTDVLDVRTNVEIAYLEAVARQRLIAVAEATVKSEETHLDQARRFVEAQAKDPIEVPQAQARAANARSALAQAQSAQAIALATLRATIGWLDAARSPIVSGDWPTPPEQEPGQLAVLVEQSRKARTELRQLDKQIEAAEANLDAASASQRPVLSANASTQWGPDEADWTPEPSWSAGITLSWQILDGGRAKAEQRIARANVASAQAQRDALLVSLTSELELARAQIIANRANVVASNEAVTAATAQLRLAEARYTHGLGSQIELADAQTAVTTAGGNLVQAQWRLAEAWAQLRRSLGER
ncbi:MAG: TolC family protein [Myxococcota bacterium]|nr:TolC family protein [Myxococcota bacterium]